MVLLSGVILADFEGLIRRAFTNQDSSNPEVRARIYQSSRAALARMIAKKPDVAPETVVRQEMMLEQSIQKIEDEFEKIAPAEPAQASTVSEPDLAIPIVPGVAKDTSFIKEDSAQVAPAVQQENLQAAPSSEPMNRRYGEGDGFEADDANGAPDLAYNYRNRRRAIKLVGWIGLLAIVAMVAYVSYLLILALVDKSTGDQPQNREVNRVSALNPVDKDNANASQYITLLEPKDTSALTTDGAGLAIIVNDVDATVLRITSLRAQDNKTQPAKPILLEIQPGILSQIKGKKVTVEVLVKSGSSGPATFSIECQFGDVGSCGRKRFRVGLQPEAVVFSIDVKDTVNQDEKAHLAIRTDIASSANLSGRGDTLDIISARLRIVGGS